MTCHLKFKKKYSSLLGSCTYDIIPFNSFPNDKILDWSKLKAFANENFNIAETMISV